MDIIRDSYSPLSLHHESMCALTFAYEVDSFRFGSMSFS